MKKNFLIALFLSLIINESYAQDDKRGQKSTFKEKKFFTSQISAGITEAEQGTNFHIETINGIRYKTWFGGIGAGLDYYYFRTIPVYLSGVKYLSPRNHSFFIQGDAGLNFAWNENTFREWNEVNSEFRPGLYWNGMFGFATGLDRKNSFSFAFGYSQKNLKEIKEMAVMCFNPPCENTFETYRYNLKRLTLRIGWHFNHTN